MAPGTVRVGISGWRYITQIRRLRDVDTPIANTAKEHAPRNAARLQAMLA